MVRKSHTMTQGELNMPLRKVRRFYQVSLPAKLSKKFGIAERDYVEMEPVAEGILVKPVTVTQRVTATRLTPKEQQLLAKAKIKQINADITSAKGLTKAEARVAAKAGLIDPEQAWWWLESWQKGEREAEEDIRAGRMSGPFESVEEFKRAVKAYTPRS
jgi:bifunctional DNA-binding transcriptional regulator/antitoxin component of YhaV-PrlF toxin-antitoxin module